jgi:hypothetical protein
MRALAPLLALVVLACTSADELARDLKPGQAVCPVCRCRGDLGCLVVGVEPGTPRCALDGKTYYFCSDECREAFERDPQRFAR